MTTEELARSHRVAADKRAAKSRRTFEAGESVVVCNGGVKGKVLGMEVTTLGTWVRVDIGTMVKLFDPARVEVVG